jgi:hypothetical protein
MRRTLILLGIVAGLVAACGGATATGALPAAGTPAGATQAGATQAGAPQATLGVTAVPTNGVAKTLDACTLITTAEAAAAVGEPVDPGAPPEPGSSSCLFTAQAISINSVEITITSVADFNPDKPSITGLTITKVSGVGDAAYTLSIGPGYIVLNVRKGQATFSVSVLITGASNDQLLDKEKTLAGLILGRI